MGIAQHCLRPERDSRSIGMLCNELGSGKWEVFQEFCSWTACGVTLILGARHYSKVRSGGGGLPDLKYSVRRRILKSLCGQS